MIATSRAARPGAPNTSAVSSYRVNADRTLDVISADAGAVGMAAR